MKKMILKLTWALLSFLSLGLATNAQELHVTQPLTPSQVTDMVKHELPNMLQLIEPEDMQNYGFDLSDNFSDIQTSRPFYMSLLPRTNGSQAEIPTLNPHAIVVPLILNGRARCLMHLGMDNQQWKVVGIGEALLVQNQQSVFNTTTNEDGSSFEIINVPHRIQQYLVTSNGYQPLFQFSADDNMNPISLRTLIEVNNTAAIETMDMTNNNGTDLNDNNANDK